MAKRKLKDPKQEPTPEQQLKMFNNLFDEDPYIQEKMAEGEARGEARGEAKGEIRGEAKGLQKAVVTTVEVRFPPLAELAKQKVKRINKSDLLDVLLKGIIAAPDEATARLLLDTFAA